MGHKGPLGHHSFRCCSAAHVAFLLALSLKIHQSKMHVSQENVLSIHPDENDLQQRMSLI